MSRLICKIKNALTLTSSIIAFVKYCTYRVYVCKYNSTYTVHIYFIVEKIFSAVLICDVKVMVEIFFAEKLSQCTVHVIFNCKVANAVRLLV